MSAKKHMKDYVLPEDAAGYRAELIRLGWRSVRRWAMANDFEPRTVGTVLERWGSRKDRKPLGGIGRQVMSALQKTIAEQHRPSQPKK